MVWIATEWEYAYHWVKLCVIKQYVIYSTWAIVALHKQVYVLSRRYMLLVIRRSDQNNSMNENTNPHTKTRIRNTYVNMKPDFVYRKYRIMVWRV